MAFSISSTVAFGFASQRRAASPAMCGAAIDVPSSRPNFRPGNADSTSTPGPDTRAPVFEKSAMVNPCSPVARAATETSPSDTAGGLTSISKSGLTSRWLSFPAAAMMMQGFSVKATFASTSDARRSNSSTFAR